MKDQNKTKARLIAELQEMRRRMAETEPNSMADALQEAVTESERQFSALYNSMTEGICQHEVIYDDKGKAVDYRILNINPQYEKIVNLKRDDVVGKLATDVYDTDEAPYLETYARVADTGEPAKFETYFPPMDKHFSISVFSPGKGEFATVFEDVTEQKRSAEKLVHLNKVLQSIRNVNQLITHEKDGQRLIEQTCRLLKERGYNSAWLVLLDDEQKPVGSAQSGCEQEFARLLKQFDKGSFNACAKRALKRSGVITISDPKSTCGDCPLLDMKPGLRAMTIRLEHGKRVFGLLSVELPAEFVEYEEEQALFKEVAGDIAFALHSVEVEAKQKQAEENLRTQKERLNNILEGTNVGTWEWNVQTGETIFNEKWANIIGYTLKEISPVSIDTWMKFAHPDDLKKSEELLEKHFNGELDYYHFESRMKHKDGSWIWVLDRGKVITRDDDGKPLWMFGTHTDITERKQAEQKLEESEENYKVTLENLQVGVVVHNKDGSVLFSNPEASQILGLTEEQIQGKELINDGWSFVNDDLSKMKVEDYPVSRVISTKQVLNNYQVGIKTQDRDFITWVIVNATPVFSDNELDKIIVNFVNITERKQAEKFLREREERWSALTANFEGIIQILDKTGVIEFMSRVYPPHTMEDVVGKSAFDFMDEASADKARQALKDVIAGSQAQSFEIEIHLPDDAVVPFEVKYVPQFKQDGSIDSIISLVTDITERKKAEEEINKLGVAIEQSPACVVITDKDGTIEYVNPVFCRLTGYSYEEAIGQNPRVLKSGEMPKEQYEQLWQTISGGKEWRGEFHNKKKNGELFWENAVISPVFNKLGDITHYLAVKEDITEKKQTEEQAAKLEQQLRRSQKLETVGTLAGGIAHDFNNILTPIMGYADMGISGMSPSDPLYEDLQHILTGAHRAKELVEQILTFSRQVEKERQPLKLHLIVKEAVKLLRPSIPTTIEIRQRIDASCSSVLADATQMHQVIVNLCTNAWQSMEQNGGVLTIELKQVEVDEMTVKTHPNLKQQEYVRLSINDTGSGMDNATIERIFEPFFTTKAVDKGTGLGLSVVHGIIRSHHGDIMVYSEPGKGSVFHLYLPVHATTDKITDKKAAAPIQGGNEHILIVDDEQAIAVMLQRMLERLGYQVELCSGSIDALKMLRQQAEKFNLVISDLTMPEMTGLELAKKLQQIRAELPIIIMTGYGESLSPEMSAHYGIKQVLGKPIEMRKLAEAIRKELDI